MNSQHLVAGTSGEDSALSFLEAKGACSMSTGGAKEYR